VFVNALAESETEEGAIVCCPLKQQQEQQQSALQQQLLEDLCRRKVSSMIRAMPLLHSENY
jgi:hypothetical protein